MAVRVEQYYPDQPVQSGLRLLSFDLRNVPVNIPAHEAIRNSEGKAITSNENTEPSIAIK